MPIDWFTVAAQAINFLLLVWLMKRFLYKPVLRSIDSREKRIEEQLGDAKALKMEALKEKEEFQRKAGIVSTGRYGTDERSRSAQKKTRKSISREKPQSSAEIRGKWGGTERDASRLR